MGGEGSALRQPPEPGMAPDGVRHRHEASARRGGLAEISGGPGHISESRMGTDDERQPRQGPPAVLGDRPPDRGRVLDGAPPGRPMELQVQPPADRPRADGAAEGQRTGICPRTRPLGKARQRRGLQRRSRQLKNGRYRDERRER